MTDLVVERAESAAPVHLTHYGQYAYARFLRNRRYVWGSWSNWFRRNYPLAGKLVLDFGSGGSGAGSYIMREYRAANGHVGGYRGYDASVEIKAWLAEQGVFYDFWNDDNLQGRFDMIIGNQIYEHLEAGERVRFVERATALLREGGLLVLTYPFNLYNMNFRYFWEDITHKPVGVEAEAGLIALFGYRTQITLGGLKGDPFPLWENLLCLFRNLVLLYPPFWLVNIRAEKDSRLRKLPVSE